MNEDIASTRIIGLGGAGSRVIRTLLSSFPDIETALAVDATFEVFDLQRDFPRVARTINLTHDFPTLVQAIEECAKVDPSTREGQDRLKFLASWRVKPDQFNGHLAMGAGQYRAIGATLAEARRDVLTHQLQQVCLGAKRVLVVASISGGTGSSMISRVVREIQSNSIHPTQVDVVLLVRYPAGVDFASPQMYMNSLATLMECRSLASEFDSLQCRFQCVDSSEPGWEKIISSEVLDGPSNLYEEDLNDLDEWIDRFTLEVFKMSQQSLETGSRWSRCVPVIQASGLDRESVRRLMQGYLKAICCKAVSFDGQTQVGSITGRDGITHAVNLLRRKVHDSEILPSLIESASYRPGRLLASGSDGADWFSALMEWSLVDWSDIDLNRSRSVLADPVGYSAHYLGSVEQNYIEADGSIEVSSFLRRQISLVRDLQAIEYDGTEGLDGRGVASPPEILFRDIARDYESLLLDEQNQVERLRQIKEVDGGTVVPSVQNNDLLSIKSSIPRWVSAKRLMKPFWLARYAAPALLALISAGLFLGALNSTDIRRNNWSDSATVVAGLMGGLAVCLGAIALISSIQNSSVLIQRTDQLFSSSAGVTEAVKMFNVALTKARLTPGHATNSSDPWSHPSVRLAALILGKRLVSALDDGLFGILELCDRDQKNDSNRLDQSLSLQVFVLLDDLVRVSPEILELEVSINPGTPAAADKIQLLANTLSRQLGSFTYRDISKYLRGL